MHKLRQAVLVLVVLLALIGGISLGLFNSQMVRFDYLAGEVELPLIALLVIAAIVSLLLAAAVSAVPYLRLRRRVARLQKELDRLRSKDTVASRLPASQQ